MMLKAIEISLLLLFAIPVILAFLAVPVMAIWWLPKGKLFTLPGHIVADRGIILRHESPVVYWLFFLGELVQCPLIALGLLGGVISAILGP